MSRNFVQSAFLRDTSIGLFRLYAQAQFWRSGPRIFVNSLPKAGTHLLMSMLELVPGIMNSRLHVLSPSVLTWTSQGPEFDGESLRRKLQAVRNGQVASAHLPYDKSISASIRSNGFGTVNLIRSPRDMLISRYFYIKGLRRHHLHDHLTQNYPDKQKMILAIITGPKPGEDNVDGQFKPYAEQFRHYTGWLGAEGVLTLRYEDLVGTKGGGDDERQFRALSDLSRHLDLPVSAENLQDRWKAVQDRATATLRKGAIGDWVNHFDDEIEAAYREHLSRVTEPYETYEPVRS